MKYKNKRNRKLKENYSKNRNFVKDFTRLLKARESLLKFTAIPLPLRNLIEHSSKLDLRIFWNQPSKFLLKSKILTLKTKVCHTVIIIFLNVKKKVYNTFIK